MRTLSVRRCPFVAHPIGCVFFAGAGMTERVGYRIADALAAHPLIAQAV